MTKKMNIPFSPPDISEKEIEAVSEALRSGWITTGPRTKELERQMAEFTGTKRGACLNSATACMETALRLFGIGAGDEVIVPAYTYTASASVVCHVGATLKLIDVQEGTYHLDYDELEAAITEKTKAVIPVDIAGVMVDYDKIRLYLSRLMLIRRHLEEFLYLLIRHTDMVRQEMDIRADNVRTLHHFLSMLLRTLQQVKVEALYGENLTE